MCAFTRKLSATKSISCYLSIYLTKELEVFGIFTVLDLGHVHKDVPDDVGDEVELQLDPGEVTPEVLHVDREVVAGKECVEDFLLPEKHHEGLLTRDVTIKELKCLSFAYNLLAMIRLKMKPKTKEKLLAIASTRKIMLSFSGT